jgi:membrane-bound ClpP family serine protease
MIVTLVIIAFFGVLLIILETFLPGGIVGTLGGLLILVSSGLVLYLPDFAAWSSLQRGILAFGIIAGSVTLSLIWLRCFAVKFGYRAFTLDAKVSSPTQNSLPLHEQSGIAISELRPLGRAEIAGDRHDVRCEDGFAAIGARIIVTGREPGNLIVRLQD